MFFQREMLADPQRFNLYAYARNNPLKFVDPSGEAIELSDDPAERQRQIDGLCSMARLDSDECRNYIYVDNKTKKGHYYVGILVGGASGTGPDFGSINDVTAALQEIIRDRHLATVEIVQGTYRIDTPAGAAKSLNNIPAEGVTTLSESGQYRVYVRAASDPTGYDALWFWKMSNWRRGARDQDTVMGHEMGHLLYRMKARHYDDAASDKAALDLENKVRKLKNPSGPTRTRH